MADPDLLMGLAEQRVIIGDKATMVGTIGVEEEPAVKMLQYASTGDADVYTAGIFGTYFVFGKKPHFNAGKPMLAKFCEADDAVIMCLKQVGKSSYLYGITVPKLKEWVPPASAGTLVEETGLMQSWRVEHEDIESMRMLENTETHPLKDLADKLIAHMPTFAAHKIKSSKEMKAWCARTFEKNIKAVVNASELAERKRAAAKSATARDAAATESVAGGRAAKEKWEERKKLLLLAEPYYKDSFEDRFIVIELDEATQQPTEKTLTEIRADLACVHALESCRIRWDPPPLPWALQCARARHAARAFELTHSHCGVCLHVLPQEGRVLGRAAGSV